MDPLDDIWDEPVEETPANIPSRSEPLFLTGSDDEEAPRHLPQDVNVDIEAMFAEVEEEDDPFSIKPLTSNLNLEALTREAETRHKKAIPPSLTPHAIMSSSPPRDLGDDGSTKRMGTDKGRDMKKERRKPARLDEGRLLGPTGFPKLIKDTKNFKTKGKGHEATDLNRLLQVYGYWTHELYPKTTFRDTVERVEKLCHSKRMHVALSVWRDEARGIVKGRQPKDDDEVIDLTENADHNTTTREGSSRASSPVSDGAAYASSSSRPPSRPPSSGTELDDDDDFDIDAVIRDEEQRLANSSTNLTTQGKDYDDDAAMWDAVDSMHGTTSHILRSIDGDTEMWDELDALQNVEPDIPAARTVIHPPPARNEDEDMWDVLQELENGSAAVNGGTVVGQGPRSTVAASPEDDWDSVYA